LTVKKSKSAIWIFSVISGVFFLSSNAVLMLVPLRMADQGLSYGAMGSVMASSAIVMLLVKFLAGRHSDMIGVKKYVCVSLVIFSFSTLLLAFANAFIHYLGVLLAVGLGKGIFNSVNASYTFALVDRDEYGKGYGKVQGITSALSSIAGLLVGFLYGIHQGRYALLIVTFLLFITTTIAFVFLPNAKENQPHKQLFSKGLFKDMDKHIFLFCFIVFLQTFVTSPMWILLVPMYFYRVFAVSASFVGMVMSLDELVSAPSYIAAGNAADKFDIRKLTSLCYFLVSILSISLLKINSPILFLLVFLLCGLFATFTYAAISKAEVFIIRDSARGFEFALISISAGLGDSFGNYIMGKLFDQTSMAIGIVFFSISYLLLAIITALSLNSPKFKSPSRSGMAVS